MHKFKIGEVVRILGSGFDPLRNPKSVYEVVRLVPPDGSGVPAYRIRSNGVERAVPESDLEAASTTRTSDPPLSDAPAYARGKAEAAVERALAGADIGDEEKARRKTLLTRRPKSLLRKWATGSEA